MGFTTTYYFYFTERTMVYKLYHCNICHAAILEILKSMKQATPECLFQKKSLNNAVKDYWLNNVRK